jgi:hypothetical protein
MRINLILSTIVVLMLLSGCTAHPTVSPESSSTAISPTLSPRVTTATQTPMVRNNNINFVFKSGTDTNDLTLGANSPFNTILSTFDNTFVENNSSRPLFLSQNDMDSILQRMQEMDFFNYPSKVIERPTPDSGSYIPFPIYYFQVKYGSLTKELYWADNRFSHSTTADNLRILIFTIQDIINVTIDPKHASVFDFVFTFDEGELDTFKGTFKKYIYLDGRPPAAATLVLSAEEKNTIKEKMIGIDFFNYPTAYSGNQTNTIEGRVIIPKAAYYFKVKYNNTFKELTFTDSMFFYYPDVPRVMYLKELVDLVMFTFQSHDEYKKLPPQQQIRI